MLVNSFEIEKDFWKVNPHLKLPKLFRSVYNGVAVIMQGYGKEIGSSKLMWSVSLIWDYDSKFSTYPLMDRKRLIAGDYLGDIKFFRLKGSKGYKELEDMYNELQMDSEKRYLVMWNNKVDKITSFMEKMAVNRKSINDIIDLLSKYEDLIRHKDYIDERLRKKDQESELGIRSGGRLSLLESNKI